MTNEQVMSGTDRSPFDAKSLNPEEYRDLLAEHPDLVLRVSDGARDGTYRFWVDDGALFWRCLSWTAPQQSGFVHLCATLGSDDTTAQLLIERSRQSATEQAAGEADA